MKIEAVIVSVNFGDILEHTLPVNLDKLDGLVVVTSQNDTKTIGICNYYGVSCIVTDVFYEHGAAFNKAKGINLGISHLRHDDWLLHLDADILLPHGFRHRTMASGLAQENIYGADRLNTKNYQNYENAKPYLIPQHKHGCLVDAHQDFHFGSRLSHGDYGYCPIGYFQLWHSNQKRRYPVNSGSAEHSDVLFSVQWPRQKRILIPNFFVYHLESDRGGTGQNWHGRKSPHFGPECCHKCHKPKHHCKCHHHHKPYCPK